MYLPEYLGEMAAYRMARWAAPLTVHVGAWPVARGASGGLGHIKLAAEALLPAVLREA